MVVIYAIFCGRKTNGTRNSRVRYRFKRSLSVILVCRTFSKRYVVGLHTKTNGQEQINTKWPNVLLFCEIILSVIFVSDLGSVTENQWHWIHSLCLVRLFFNSKSNTVTSILVTCIYVKLYQQCSNKNQWTNKRFAVFQLCVLQCQIINRNVWGNSEMIQCDLSPRPKVCIYRVKLKQLL